MAVKYRIYYEEYTRYQRRNKRLARKGWCGLLICVIVLLLCLLPTANKSRYEPSIAFHARATSAALEQLNRSLSRGEQVSDALSTFCENIIQSR